MFELYHFGEVEMTASEEISKSTNNGSIFLVNKDYVVSLTKFDITLIIEPIIALRLLIDLMVNHAIHEIFSYKMNRPWNIPFYHRY